MKHFDGWIGLDIGGANLKISVYRLGDQLPADSKSVPFALWKHPDQLGSKLVELLASFSNKKLGLAVTMTGELADGYPNRRAGVESIVDAVAHACSSSCSSSCSSICSGICSGISHAKEGPNFRPEDGLTIIKPVFYGIGETVSDSGLRGHHWHEAESAKANWTKVAAANWHAIASCLQFLPGLNLPLNGFLIDIGSTTTDVIPIRDGFPAARGITDLARLQSSELIYAGVARTPICSLVQRLMIGQRTASIARELFATVEDAFIVSGDVAEDYDRSDTADGRPATRDAAMQRLAKMVCADAWLGSDESNLHGDHQTQFLDRAELASMAQQVISALHLGLMNSIQQVVNGHQDLPKRFFLTGQGDWFAQRMLSDYFHSKAEIHLIADCVGKSTSHSMAAFAVASLAAVHLTDAKVAIKRNQENIGRYRVIKIGGSLLDCSGSPARIRHWLTRQVAGYQNVWIVGGGKLVDQIRRLDEIFQLPPPVSHWLALDAMSLNLRIVQQWFPDWPLVDDWRTSQNQNSGQQEKNILFDIGKWLRVQPFSTNTLPESWEITSDTCAAFLAQQIRASELVLLKSCPIDSDRSLEELAESGVVDPSFPAYASNIQQIQMVNLNGEDLF